MPQVINTNIASLNAQRNLNKSQSANQTSLQRLSSGLRINSAKDDAAGLAISTRFNSQIRGLNVAVRNAGDGISLAQTAEGALGSMNDNLQRVRELAVQSANATNSDVDRDALQAEVEQLLSEVSRTADETDFNGRKLLDGSFSATFQIGANAGQTLDITIKELTSDKLGSSAESGVSSRGSANVLGNGDLIINGEPISASRAEDDTASTVDSDQSAIAKVEAINRHSSETGVTAQVNDNVAAGSEMVASAASGTIVLNGVNISIQTTDDGATSRASVVEAINAVAKQTGVMAVDSEFDKGGVELVATDGRNIELNAGGLSTAATGLAADNTYVGGFTLVADGDVSEIVISGGNGTGNGDLGNAGLTAGTYTSGAAAYVSDTQTQSVTAATAVTASATASAGGSFINKTSAAIGGLAFTGAIAYEVTVNGQTTSGLMPSAGIMSELAANINADVSGVTAYEEVQLTITINTQATAIELGTGVSGALVSIPQGTGGSTHMENAVDAINAFDFSAEKIDVSASLGSSGDIVLDIKNFAGQTIANASLGMLLIDSSTATMTIGVGTYAAAASGAAGTNNYVMGSLAFQSNDGSEASLSLTDTSLSGELMGTKTSTQSSTYSGVNGLEDGDLSINGIGIKGAQAGADTASAEFDSTGERILSSNKELSAIAVAAAINDASEGTLVTAEVNKTVVVGGAAVTQAEANAFENGDQAGLFINGVSLGSVSLQADVPGPAGVVDFAKARADTINLINQNTGQTGVTAIDNGESITLEAADGRNISVAIDDKSGNFESIGKVIGLDASKAGIGEASFGDSSAMTHAHAGAGAVASSAEADTYETTYGTVTLTSAKQIDIDVGSNGNTELEALGFKTGTFGGGENGQFLTEIDISTFEGATEALTAIDNAIGAIASQRADLGAIQNRMESTVSNLAITSENLSAANSRIQDADFAAETAEMSRSQVLQQAGISILAQANQGPQQVLSLLG